MRAERLVVPVAFVLLPVACSSSASERDARADRPDSGSDAAPPSERDADALIVPESLDVTALAGGNGVLELVGLTLRKGAGSTELYASLKNTGEVPACDAALSVELFDTDQASVAAGIGALFAQHFYRLADGSGTIASCIGPGDVSMAALADLPSDIAIDEVGFIVYRCPYFALDVVPIDGLTVDGVKGMRRSSGTAYTGTLVNRLDLVVSNPSVTVFPVNRVGRPLVAATSRGTENISPGGRWEFETNIVDATATDYVAYPAGAFAQ